MPYVALAPTTTAGRLEGAEIRWQALLAARPQLQRAVDLQRELIGIVLELAEIVERSPLPRLTLPPRYIAAKLGRGLPVLVAEPIPLPLATLAGALPPLCDALERGGAGDRAGAIKACLFETRLDAGALLNSALRREEKVIRQVSTRLGLASELVWLVTELAVSPFVHALQAAFLAQAKKDPALDQALSAWPHGYCVYCGSWPSIIEIVGEHRTLRCSFCAFAWEISGGCIYCHESGERFAHFTPDEMRPERRVEVCRACLSYTKTVSVPSFSPFPLLLIVDMDTMELDMAAMEQRFKRPALKAFS